MSEAASTNRPQLSSLARLYWHAYYLILRAALAAAFFIGAAAATKRIGLWLTFPIAACAAALLCGFVAIMLAHAAGRVSYINRLAVIVLPLGRGKLLPMFAWSTALWSAVAIAGAIYGSQHSHTLPQPLVLRILLIASLFVDGTTFILLTQQAVNHLTPKSPGLKTVLMILAES